MNIGTKNGFCTSRLDSKAFSGKRIPESSFNSRSDILEKIHKQPRLSPPPLPPPPPPTRATSTAPAELGATSEAIKTSSPCLAASANPRRLPKLVNTRVLAPDTSFLVRSGIRETLPRIERSETQKSPRKPIAEVQIAVSDRQLLGSAPCIRPLSELLNTSKRGDSNAVSRIDHEHDAAIALLVLRDCSAQVSNMTRYWAQPLRQIPLCDFIVAQRKCQTMLENIEALKDVKILAREATAVEDDYCGPNFMRSIIPKKSKSISIHRVRSNTIPSRSSSIVSIVNAMQKDGDREFRHQSSSTDRTLTKSPISSNSGTPRLAPESSQLQSTKSFVFDRGLDRSKVFNMHISEDGRRQLNKIGKTSKSGKNRNSHMKCLHCAATDTPEWRKGPVGPTTLCNACGLFFKKLVKRFGIETASLIMKSRQIENPQDRKVPRSFCV